MSVSDVGQSGKTPEASPVAEAVKSSTRIQSDASLRAANKADATPAVSEAASVINQAIEDSLAVLVSGRNVSASGTLLNKTGSAAGIIDEALLSGDTEKLQQALQQSTPATLAALSQSLQSAGGAVLASEELATQVQSLVASQQGSAQNVATLKDSLRELANKLETAIDTGSAVPEEVLLRVQSSIQLNSGSVSNSNKEQLRTLEEALRSFSESYIPEQKSNLLNEVNTTLQLLDSSSKEVSADLTKALEGASGGTFRGESLEKVSRQVQDFLASVQKFDSLSLAKERLEKIAVRLGSKNGGEDLRNLLETIEQTLAKTTGEGRLDVAALKQLSVSSMELSRATTQEPAVSDRELQINVRELYAHLQNITLEQGAASKIQGTIDAALSSVDTPAIKESIESLGRTLEKVLAEVPAFVQGEHAGQVKQLIDSHLASATASVSSLNERVEEIFSADSIEQVLKSLATLRDSLNTTGNTSQQLVHAFASDALSSLESAQQLESGKLSLSMYVSLTQVKQDLMQLIDTIAGMGPSLEQSQTLLEVLSQQQRSQLRSLDSLLDTAIQEVRVSLEQGGGISAQPQLIDTLQELASALQQSGSAQFMELAETLRGLIQNLSKEFSGQTPVAENVLQNLLAIKESVADVGAAFEKASLMQQLTSLQQQIEIILNRGNATASGNTASGGELRELVQNIRDQLSSNNQPVTSEMQAVLSELDALSAASTARSLQSADIERLLAPLNEAAAENPAIQELFSSLTGALQGFDASPDTDQASTSAPDMSAALQALESLLKSALPASSVESVAAEFQALLDIVTRIQTKGASADSPFEQSLASVVRQLSGSLEQALNGGADKQQEVLVQFSELVRKETLRMLGQNESSTKRADTIKNLKDLAALVKGQEALLSMAPLIEAAGDPIFLLFPAILEGFLSKIEMTYYGEQEAVDTEDKREKGGRKGFKSTELALELPGLGPVSVSFSQDGKEVLCTLQFEEKTVADFVAVRVPKLEAAFSRAGFSEFNCAVTVGKVESVAPEWTARFTRGGVIA
jgi:hypothetical protein